jgi:bifunctional DNase/RNase
MVRVSLRAVRVDLQTNVPVLLLQEDLGDRRTLPIYIGTPEATAIAYAVQGVEVPRPLTHDLLANVIVALEAETTEVVITALEGSTYYAELHLQRSDGVATVSARPSDAVALAIRTGSPLFVDDELMEAEGVVLSEDELDDEDTGGIEDPEEAEEVVEEFIEFLDTIRPEDFFG